MNLSSQVIIHDEDDKKVLGLACAVAFFLEIVALTAVAWHEHWLAHPQKTNGLDVSKFIEAEVFQPLPEPPRLMEEKKTSAPPKREATLSKVPSQGKAAKPEEKQPSEENQTQSGSPLAGTHGPVAVFAPSPTIPDYLRNQNFKTNVVIDFFVTAQGAVTPRLVGSSGNEELDALALTIAKKWQFRPAEKDHKPIDSKVRLRIIFEVK